MLDNQLLFVPKLLLVDNRLNTLQEMNEGYKLHGRPLGTDKTLFQVIIYDVRTGDMIDIATISSASRLFVNNDALPEDLLQQAVSQYVQALYHPRPKG